MNIFDALQGVGALLQQYQHVARGARPLAFPQSEEEQPQLPITTTPYSGTPPYELVESEFTLPFPLYPFQQKIVNQLAPLQGQGYYMDTGTGKTATSVASMLFQLSKGMQDQFIVWMPPILMKGWHRLISKIPEVTSVIYAGTPAARSKIAMNANFIITTPGVFKKDVDRFESTFRHRKVGVTVDEATSVKGLTSTVHKTYRDFTEGRTRMLLTGTPMSTPADAYAYCKLVAPGICYRNQKHFLDLHVAKRDYFDKVVEWRNWDLARENMLVNSVRVLKRDVINELPPVTYTDIVYDLAPDHLKLYQKLAAEQLLLYENGGKLDATADGRLTHALQQIVLNWAYFAQDPSKVSAGEELCAQILDELAGKKLLVFSNYRLTNSALIQRFNAYGAVGIYGVQTPKQNEDSLDRFLDDPTCRVCFAQYKSAGYGIDGMQTVCSDVLFLESPPLMRDFHQAVARLDRVGQFEPVNVRIAIAQKTVQVKKFKALLANDEQIGKIQPNFADLRAAIYGE